MNYNPVISTNGNGHNNQNPTMSKTTTTASTEVTPKAKRRTFSSGYKRRILREAEQCQHGELGALLRREGLYSSHLSDWRRQEEVGELSGKKRGRKAKQTADEKQTAKLEQENRRLREKLRHAELIIEAQKKIAALLGNIDENEDTRV